jgi:hypothetical protein
MIRDLEWVMLSESGPPGIRERKKLKGSRGRGKTYERKVDRHLRDLCRSGALDSALGAPLHRYFQQWLCFRDAEGPGFAQPDSFVVGTRAVLLVEAKLTYTMDGDHQLRYLYGPLLEELFGLPVLRVQAFKNLRGCPGPPMIDQLAARFEREDEILGWHFMGL